MGADLAAIDGRTAEAAAAFRGSIAAYQKLASPTSGTD
jgi:hypothetical protein